MISFKRYFLILSILLIGCPKGNSNSEMSISEKERQKALNELMSKEDEEFEDIPEALGEEKEDDELR